MDAAGDADLLLLADVGIGLSIADGQHASQFVVLRCPDHLVDTLHLVAHGDMDAGGQSLVGGSKEDVLECCPCRREEVEPVQLAWFQQRTALLAEVGQHDAAALDEHPLLAWHGVQEHVVLVLVDVALGGLGMDAVEHKVVVLVEVGDNPGNLLATLSPRQTRTGACGRWWAHRMQRSILVSARRR